jgi:hypothetical protein
LVAAETKQVATSRRWPDIKSASPEPHAGPVIRWIIVLPARPLREAWRGPFTRRGALEGAAPEGQHGRLEPGRFVPTGGPPHPAQERHPIDGIRLAPIVSPRHGPTGETELLRILQPQEGSRRLGRKYTAADTAPS